MNNHLDENWFGRKDVFNMEKGKGWNTVKGHIEFPKRKIWKDYVLLRGLEITCGEAPFIVSRYDTVTGNLIPLEHRIGVLDRKLRVVDENAENDEQWQEWIFKAFQSTYGYEFQGDNLFIARVNLLTTFLDYWKRRFSQNPSVDIIRKISNIIVWNFWQMDGLTGTIPFTGEYDEQLSLFSSESELRATPCKIWDWRSGNALTYNSIKKKLR